MTFDSNPEGFSDFDPIRDVFMEASLAEILEAVQGEPATDEPIDSLSSAVNFGLIAPDVADEIRDLEREDFIRIFRESVEGLQRKADEQKNVMGDSSLKRYLSLRLRHLFEGDPMEDFVPYVYFKDDQNNPSGMTPEEWAALPQSAKITLREALRDTE